MFGQHSLSSVISFMKDLPSRLNQPLPLPDILLTPIPLPLPSFFNPRLRRYSQRTRAKARKQSSANKETEILAGQFQFAGALETGATTIYSVGGRDFVFDSDTWVFGDIGIGAYARIKGSMRNGERYATHITVGRE